MAERAGPEVRVWAGRGGWWGWTFRDRDGTEIVANRLFRSRHDAAEAAERAYPGMPVRDPEPEAGGRFPMTMRALAVAALAGAAVVLGRRARRRAIRVRRAGGE